MDTLSLDQIVNNETVEIYDMHVVQFCHLYAHQPFDHNQKITIVLSLRHDLMIHCFVNYFQNNVDLLHT